MRKLLITCLLILLISSITYADIAKLESRWLKAEINDVTGQWSLLDKRSQMSWPTNDTAIPGTATWLEGNFNRIQNANKNAVHLHNKNNGTAVIFALVDEGRALEISYDGKANRSIHLLEDALAVTDIENGYVIVPCREGLLISANSGKTFKRVFGTSDYEGCHMNMLGFIKSGSALIATWDDAYVFPQLQSTKHTDKPYNQKLTTTFELRQSAKSVRLMPLGKGDWNTIATGYRRYTEKKGLAITLKEKIQRDKHLELMIGAVDAKLWTCLARRMNEESTKEESVRIRWTFDEAAKIAEHLRNDLDIERCLFMVGGWTEGGYDCRHPDNLPANPECGGNEALSDAIKRIQALGYVGCLHDNVQDMYRDAKSWNPAFIEKRRDGSLITGGRWLGGRAYMVCAPKQLELAKRPQNLPAIHELFSPWSYFIDTTYAVGPRECFDPNHPIDRNSDIAWKIRLSDYAREVFGIFGSECGREWALPHSDFFEGLVAVRGTYYHNLKPDEFGATVIPFFEMVYHDCQICYGKYGYQPEKAAECVAHHILCARPLYYHSFPDHLYWQSNQSKTNKNNQTDISCYTRCDNGWAENMYPLDVFIKNTYEVLGPLHSTTAHDVLSQLEFLNKERTLRQATYGNGKNATKIIVNFGKTKAQIKSELAGNVVLPSWGFIIEGPRFAAFYALSWNTEDYDEGTLFTLQSKDDKDLKVSKSIRVFHAFGPEKLRWKDKIYEIKHQQIIQPQ